MQQSQFLSSTSWLIWTILKVNLLIEWIVDLISFYSKLITLQLEVQEIKINTFCCCFFFFLSVFFVNFFSSFVF